MPSFWRESAAPMSHRPRGGLETRPRAALCSGLPLRLNEQRFFTPTNNPAIETQAFRFAFLCLFRRDIDRGHRLTMVHDADALRLTLLLALFFGVGNKHWLQEDTLPSLPARLPLHIRSADSSSSPA